MLELIITTIGLVAYSFGIAYLISITLNRIGKNS
jgi:hypothetical protein